MTAVGQVTSPARGRACRRHSTKPRAPRRTRRNRRHQHCGHDCGGRCVVNAHVRDGRIVHISTDARRWNPDHPRCLPAPAASARSSAPIIPTVCNTRCAAPARAAVASSSASPGTRRWTEVAEQLLRVRETYGNAAILDASRTGSTAMLHSRAVVKRFLHMFGGCTDLWSNMSAEAEVFAVRTTFGDEVTYKAAGREPTDYENSTPDPDVGLEPRRRHVRNRNHAASESREAARHAHHLRRPPPDDDQPTARRGTHLHPPLHRRRRADRDGAGDRQREPARPGVLRSLCAGLR